MRFLLVDGHSVIFASPELRKLHARRNALARETLIAQLTQYQDSSGVRVVVVFDGQGSQCSSENHPGQIQVIYSATGQTADQVIERLVATYAGAHDLTVVTNDLAEQQTVLSFGGHPIPCESFHALLCDAASDLGRRLQAHKKKARR
jgi:predicted RNA-binding protein with PIN domain